MNRVYKSLLLFSIILSACMQSGAQTATRAAVTAELSPTSTLFPTQATVLAPSPPSTLLLTDTPAQPLAPQGAIYYVAPTGDDFDPGSLEEPWQTIQHAAETLGPGETVYIRQGVYNEQVVPANSGTPGNYITYAAYPGESPTIDGAGLALSQWDGLFNIVGQSYIHVSGLRVINAGPGPNNPGILADTTSQIIIENNFVSHTSDSGIMAWGSQNVLIDGNEVQDACYGGYNESISLGETAGFEVRNNHVHDSAKEGICTKDGSSNGSVHHNQVHDVKLGIYVDAQGRYTSDIEVYANTVYQNSDDGIDVASEMGGLLEDVRLYNNIIYDNTFCGFAISHAGESPDHPLQDITFINNTLYHNGVDWGGGICIGNGDAEGVVLRNNLVSQNLSFQIADEEGLLTGKMVVDYNLVDGFRGYPGELYGDNAVTGDPLFADPDSNDFHLQAGSPAIDAASASEAPDQDFDSFARPVDGDGNGSAIHDIGAYEFIPLTGSIYLPLVFRPGNQATGNRELGLRPVYVKAAPGLWINDLFAWFVFGECLCDVGIFGRLWEMLL